MIYTQFNTLKKKALAKHCGEIFQNKQFHSFSMFLYDLYFKIFNPLPHMPILGFSNSGTNTDMSEIWTNGDTIICLSRKHCGKRREIARHEQFLLFPQCFQKLCRNEYLWSKGLISTFHVSSTASLNSGRFHYGVLRIQIY